jgi:hypothetical protein
MFACVLCVIKWKGNEYSSLKSCYFVLWVISKLLHWEDDINENWKSKLVVDMWSESVLNCKKRFPQYGYFACWSWKLHNHVFTVYVILLLLLPLTSCWSCQTFQLFTAIVWTGCKQEAIKMQSGGKIPVSWLKAGMPCRTIGRSENLGGGGG